MASVLIIFCTCKFIEIICSIDTKGNLKCSPLSVRINKFYTNTSQQKYIIFRGLERTLIHNPTVTPQTTVPI